MSQKTERVFVTVRCLICGHIQLKVSTKKDVEEATHFKILCVGCGDLTTAIAVDKEFVFR